MNYFIKRLLWLIPTIFVLSLLIFGISLTAPYLPDSQLENYASKSTNVDFLNYESRLDQYRKSTGTFAPAFYIRIYPASLSDTLYKISNPKVRASIEKWALDIGNWTATNALYARIKRDINVNPDDANELIALFENSNYNRLKSENAYFSSIVEDLDHSFTGNQWLNFIPSLSWNGSNNRYHQWIKGVLSFDLGRSMVDNRPLSQTIAYALKWTISLGMISLLIALLIAIPLAAKAASNPNGFTDRFCNVVFFGLYSIPLFWMASLLIIFFASVHYLHWFPSFGIGEVQEGMGFFDILSLRMSHLALPLICWTYGALAVIYRHMRAKLKEEIAKDYTLTARSKGLSNRAVIWKHAFRNSTFPLITMLGAILPGMIGGSFIIESVFSIPGMGKLTLDAFLQRDYPLIFNISFLACVLTVLGVFLADIAYYFADPRLKFSESNG